MPLTDTTLRNLKTSDRTIKMADGGGLFIQIEPSGSKLWRLAYRFDGKQKLLALGAYPYISLKDARAKREEAKTLLASGIDPSERRKEERELQSGGGTFEFIARQWIAKMVLPKATPEHTNLVTRRLELDVFPHIGATMIRDLRASDILAVLERMELRGVTVSAHRVRQIIGQIFRFAVAAGKADFDPTTALRGALTPIVEEHRPAITDPKAVGELLRAINGYSGDMVTRCALRLAPLLFVRPGELRHAEWIEIDLEAATWIIPGAKMKMGTDHMVPLSHQAVGILRELHPLTGFGRYVFPGARTAERPMSENTITAALRRMGYAVGEMTGHGFRSMASTLLNEQGWNRDAIERQLAHSERDAVRAAYNRAEHLPERRRMMQAWADNLDQLAGRNVAEIKERSCNGW